MADIIVLDANRRKLIKARRKLIKAARKFELYPTEENLKLVDELRQAVFHSMDGKQDA